MKERADELVKRLAQAIKNIWLADVDALDWTAMARAAIAELAKSDVSDVLPTGAELLRELGAKEQWEPEASAVIEAIRSHVAPIVFAQRIRLSDLEADIAACGALLSEFRKTQTANGVAALKNERDELRARLTIAQQHIAKLKAENEP